MYLNEKNMMDAMKELMTRGLIESKIEDSGQFFGCTDKFKEMVANAGLRYGHKFPPTSSYEDIARELFIIVILGTGGMNKKMLGVAVECLYLVTSFDKFVESKGE